MMKVIKMVIMILIWIKIEKIKKWKKKYMLSKKLMHINIKKENDDKKMIKR